MKKLFFIGILLALVLCAGFSSQKLVVSGGTGWYPLFMKDANGEAYGISVDILKEVAKKLNIPLEAHVDIPWRRVLNDVELGSMDVLCGIYYTEERAQIYDYTIPFMQNQTRIFVMKGKEFEVNSLKDLTPKLGTMPAGGSFGMEFDNFKVNLKLDDSRDKEVMFRKLLADRAEYVLSDFYDATFYSIEQGFADKVVALDFVINSVDVYLIVSKATKIDNLLEVINETIEELITDGRLDEMLSKYK